MSPRHNDARQRVVAATAEMLARHGLNATSIREMAKRADAPLGSTYHHFPGGKQQVVVEAVKFAGAQVRARLEHHLQAGAKAGLAGFLSMWRDVLLRSDFRLGCPVMAVAVEEPIDAVAEEALAAAAAVFADWEGLLANALTNEGHEPESAAKLATLIVASVEGAIVLCRAQRSIAPFDKVAERIEWAAGL
ncbi:AcrR family transcriptional regulator [Luteibacter jiangsuensis]|uniref:AcrR family transcriptional regulator n=1 Tax=Luteibacter jiangsuensis TaxID=637577 RepID=A0ABT9SXR0_9GAMM|nr:TetR/AcrR family transcriptional regulator [Luteibacter jiangsuensis]MDQ0009098.1 AcrR family transcriptional regulator [Luteibacter jiangsuensis]